MVVMMMMMTTTLMLLLKSSNVFDTTRNVVATMINLTTFLRPDLHSDDITFAQPDAIRATSVQNW